MSHLIVEQGKEVGKEVAVPPAGIKFGRSPANDLVLEDDVLMPFHGRFFFKSDGTLWVTDFGAGEKTKVGGVPVDEHLLKVGDLVEAGNTAFRVINAQVEEADLAIQPDEEEVDLGFKSAPKKRGAAPAKERSKSAVLVSRILQVLVVLLIVLFLVVALPEIIKLNDPEGSLVTSEKTLSFVYERVMGDKENIFRYHLELGVDGQATLQADDLKSRHVMKSKLVDAKVLETLSQRLAGSGFFEVEGHREVKSKNQYQLYDIAICLDGQFNHIRMLNREPPSEIHQTVSILEEFVFEILEVPFTLLEDPETMIGNAEAAFKLGELRFSERGVKPGNLVAAIGHYEESIVYLETLEPKPELYRHVLDGLDKARAEQDVLYKDYMFNVDRAMRLGDWGEALENLRVLAELIPDRKDERYKKISVKQLNVEGHLK